MELYTSPHLPCIILNFTLFMLSHNQGDPHSCTCSLDINTMNLPTCIIFMFTTFCLPNLCRSQPREFSGACCASWLWLSSSRSASSWKNKSHGTDSKYQTCQLDSKVVVASVKCTNVTKTIMMSHVQLVFHLPTLSMSNSYSNLNKFLKEQSDYHQDQLQRL